MAAYSRARLSPAWEISAVSCPEGADGQVRSTTRPLRKT
jgi:hypothetical protein